MARLAERCPQQAASTLAAAERILSHEFDLLGSGPFVPDDPDRSAGPGRYRPIDWYWDPVSQLRFPRGVPYRDWDLYRMRPGLADIKLPWELARCHHWVTLGQAYRLSGDERYAAEIRQQLQDFMEANPVGIGIHWTCTMDVAIRALNWALALALVRPSPEPTGAFWEDAYSALFAHGEFIYENLENTGEVTSNHFLSNVVGLYYVASVFRRLPQVQVWDAFCRRSLEEETEAQVLDDGADFESSVPYHRLVTELFLGAARLAHLRGEPLSPRYQRRLERMVEFLLGVLRPDGLMPQVGDADDGRLHILTAYGRWNPQDARHLFTPAAALLRRPSWFRHAGADGVWEAAWWGLEVDERLVTQEPLPSRFALFPRAGLAVMREGGHYLLVTNGVVGTKGIGNHKHNDQLSFEYHWSGVPVLVDPGSYVYTGDPEARNRFRSTASHNTLCVDGQEQNDCRPEWLFRLFECAYPEHLAYEVHETHAEYRGRHVAYRRLEPPVVHERSLRLLRGSGALQLQDRLVGHGEHRLSWRFQCAPGVDVSTVDAQTYLLSAGEARLQLRIAPGIESRITSAWYSPSYGIRQPCLAVDLHATVVLHGDETWMFTVAPHDAGHTE